MEQPNGPSVPLSEPELERRMAESAMDDIQNDEFDGVQVYLPYVKEFLSEHGLDVDEEGFVVDAETGEYAVPYVFVDDLVREYVKDEDESVFEAFFRPVTHERVYGWDNERLHLSDVHSVIATDDGAHPVRDRAFDMAEFYARLETGFRVIMGWSDLVKDEGIDEEGRWLGLAQDSDEAITLTCLSLDCNYSGELESWDGDEHASPECPDCGGEWDADGITVCTICNSWYWGTYFAGESLYAEPACANCGADMEYLERVHRYDDVDSYESLVEEERPQYTVYGVGADGEVVYTFDHVETWDDAVEEKELAEHIIGGSGFEEVETVAIRERDGVEEVTRYVREDDQPL